MHGTRVFFSLCSSVNGAVRWDLGPGRSFPRSDPPSARTFLLSQLDPGQPLKSIDASIDACVLRVARQWDHVLRCKACDPLVIQEILGTFLNSPSPGGQASPKRPGVPYFWRASYTKPVPLGRMNLAARCAWPMAAVLQQRQSTHHRRGPEGPISLSQAGGLTSG